LIQFITLYPKSIDLEWIDKNITELAVSFGKAPGFRSMNISDGDIMSPAGPTAYSKVVETTFESLEDFMGWVQSPWSQSPEQQAVKNFMIEKDAIMLFLEVKES